MKELIRVVIFYCPFIPEELRAESGTLKCKILDWLYGADSRTPLFYGGE